MQNLPICNCHNNSNYIYQPSGHVITGNLNFIQQDSVSIYVVCKHFIWPDFQNSEKIDKNR